MRESLRRRDDLRSANHLLLEQEKNLDVRLEVIPIERSA